MPLSWLPMLPLPPKLSFILGWCCRFYMWWSCDRTWRKERQISQLCQSSCWPTLCSALGYVMLPSVDCGTLRSFLLRRRVKAWQQVHRRMHVHRHVHTHIGIVFFFFVLEAIFKVEIKYVCSSLMPHVFHVYLFQRALKDPQSPNLESRLNSTVSTPSEFSSFLPFFWWKVLRLCHFNLTL